jgi:hypothetical protein
VTRPDILMAGKLIGALLPDLDPLAEARRFPFGEWTEGHG